MNLDILAIKLAHSPPDLPGPVRPIVQLRRAKEESDRRRYRAKHDILRKLIVADPSAFVIDSEDRGIVGLTAMPSGFRIHIPRTALPPVQLRRLPLPVGGPRAKIGA